MVEFELFSGAMRICKTTMLTVFSKTTHSSTSLNFARFLSSPSEQWSHSCKPGFSHVPKAFLPFCSLLFHCTLCFERVNDMRVCKDYGWLFILFPLLIEFLRYGTFLFHLQKYRSKIYHNKTTKVKVGYRESSYCHLSVFTKDRTWFEDSYEKVSSIYQCLKKSLKSCV